MTPAAAEQAARLLAALRLGGDGGRTPIEDLPLACRPHSLADAYAVQSALAAALEARGHGPRVGWKIGCTTPVMQAYLHIDHPCAGHLYQPTVQGAGAVLRASSYLRLGLECEIAVRLRTDLDPSNGGHDRASVASAVGTVMTSVEVVEHRFRDFAAVAAASLVADDFFSAGCVLGAPLDVAGAPDLATLHGGFRVDGEPHEGEPGITTGSGAAILHHPLNALAWLADHAAAQGEPLRRGQVVTLGSVVKTIYPEPPCVVEACFAGLSPVRIEIR